MSNPIKKLLFRTLYYSGLYRLIGTKTDIAILMYHGISKDETPEWTQLSVKQFEQQMRYITNNCSPLSLADAIACLSGKKQLPEKPVVVTFDDGYLSNFTLAKDILEEYQIPATVFVTTALITEANEPPVLLWFDRIYNAFLNTAATSFAFEPLGLNDFDFNTTNERVSAAEKVMSLLKEFPADKKNDFVGRIVDKLQPPKSSPPKYHGASWAEIKQAEPIISVGAHTVNHEILTRLSPQEAELEISNSKSIIEDKTGDKVEHFAYPNGRKEDFNDTIIEFVRKAGYTGAVTTVEGLNKPGENPYTLKRIAISSDIDYIQFVLLTGGTISSLKKLIGT